MIDSPKILDYARPVPHQRKTITIPSSVTLLIACSFCTLLSLLAISDQNDNATFIFCILPWLSICFARWIDHRFKNNIAGITRLTKFLDKIANPLMILIALICFAFTFKTGQCTHQISWSALGYVHTTFTDPTERYCNHHLQPIILQWLGY